MVWMYPLNPVHLQFCQWEYMKNKIIFIQSTFQDQISIQLLEIYVPIPYSKFINVLGMKCSNETIKHY